MSSPERDLDGRRPTEIGWNTDDDQDLVYDRNIRALPEQLLHFS